MKNAIILSLALGLVCTLAAAILSFANVKTMDVRKQATLANKNAALGDVLPAFDNKPIADTVVCGEKSAQVAFYRARANGQLVGVAGEATAKGFGGPLTVLVQISPAGELGAVVVTKHTETPGLGTQATDRKRQKTLASLFGGGALPPAEGLAPCLFLDRFRGLEASLGRAVGAVAANELPADTEVNAATGKVLAVSGATISSRAVSVAVGRVAAAFAEHRQEIVQ